jgi:hypothetical protein
MPTYKTKATKMSDARVSFISLVERGANRIPFKIIKQENGMTGKPFAGIDLGNLFTQKAETGPMPVELLGVATMQDDDYQHVLKGLSDCGLKIDAPVAQDDGSVVLKQVEGVVEGGGSIVRLNEHIALVTKNFTPYMMDIQVGDISFAEAVSEQGFYPGASTVLGVLSSSVMKSLEESTNPAETAAQVGVLFDEARQYISSLVEALPAVAFKLDGLVILPDESDPAPPVDPPAVTAPADAAAGDVAKDDPDTPATTPDPAPVVPQNTLTEEQLAGIVSSAVTTAVAAVTQKMDDALQAMEAKLTETQAIATGAAAKLAGIVVSGSNTPDPDPVKKSERVGFGREIDTAFMPRANRPRRVQ